MFKRFEYFIFRIRQLLSLGNGFCSKVKIAVAFFIFLFLSKFKIYHTRRWPFRLKKFGVVFDFWLGSAFEMEEARQIFLEEEYDLNLKEDPKIILDTGSNIGLSVVYFKLKYPNSSVYAFEPNGDIFEVLAKNTKRFDSIYLFNLAVSNFSGPSAFFVNKKNNLSSSLLRRGADDVRVKVATESLDDFMDRMRLDSIDLLKFDVEGEEFKIFKGFKNLNKIKNLVGEVHLDLAQESLDTFLGFFRAYELDIQEIKKGIRYIFKAKRKQ